MGNPRVVLARRTLGSLRSEKTIVLALVIQLFIAGFSSFLVVGLVSLYDPGTTNGDALTVSVGVTGNASSDVAATIADDDSRSVVPYPSQAAASAAFQRGDVQALVHATRQPGGRILAAATAPEGSFRTTLVVTELKGALSTLERERRADLDHRLERTPVDLPPDERSNPYFSFTYTVLLPLLAFLPAFISGSVMADSMAEELERDTLSLLRVAPLSLPEIVDGKAIALVGLAPAQVALWLLLLWLNGTHIANPLALLALVAGVAAVLVATGAALALRVGARREAQLLYSFVALAVFGVASLLPQSPQNLIARLAVDSPTTLTWGLLGVALTVAAASYTGLRWLAGGAET
ncbi:ABC transporter permease [Halobacterium salinarum]|uniref:ABC-type transport system permease protein n=4 Tax=Halobacterium salinarum TaxID=2242 RepID=A0A510N585_HALSA|nr:ABC transporter permease [Halobacterium salinarum]MBB6090025.1 ABC-type Na+ efflux pump permease subunit [Halobacterium salinarum]MDL0120741.1 ABC transporter permease [Halobacterium salinarum]MDL0130618.1 ABC transporter permease [Halobacterium salinarum]MDL0133034.1 ABC transporter permease [Halobacterium salinarum]MDL0141740.1 ABC transporter permease [Halobacterium salinarum]